MKRSPFLAHVIPCVVVLSLLDASINGVRAQEAQATNASKPAAPQFAGPMGDSFLLPNGWTLTPAGEHIVTNDLPLNIIPLANSPHVLLATSGYNQHQLCLIDTQAKKIIDRQMAADSWFGLLVDQQQSKVWWSGGGKGEIHQFTLQDGKLKPKEGTSPKQMMSGEERKARARLFQAGMCWNHDRSVLFGLNIDAGLLQEYDPESLTIKRTLKLGGRPYDVVDDSPRKQLVISDWAGKKVWFVDRESFTIAGTLAVGDHPNQIVLHPKYERAAVACANSNEVCMIDLTKRRVAERISTSLFARAPAGSTPDAVAFSPDGNLLAVANADNNCVALVDCQVLDKSQVKGFIPTGWYPTAVSFTLDGKQLLVGVGKGLQSKANPINDKFNIPDRPFVRPTKFPYIGTTMSGALSIVPLPSDEQLAKYTAAVYRNCPYADTLLTSAPSARATAIPTKVGVASPIKHVIYIIKENRTYDQIFGDIAKGNGDPKLCMFPENVTPNHHKLANEFVLLDNLYCNGQVSRDGHPWSTMAYHTDYIARDWHLTYSNRAGIDDDDEDNLQRAPNGYIWDACKRVGVSYRSYGEYGHRVSQPDGTFKIEGSVPGLVGHVCPNYGVEGVNPKEVRDSDRVQTFLKEFAKFEAEGTLPQFMIISLGEDHTHGTVPTKFTPQSCVASNDLALGQLVDAVSKSKSWPKLAIFVIEDDAQNGPDHVDAHRTVGLVISPYTKRQHVDSTQYSTVSMIRTMELILGIPPLSQYDAAARPMFESFNLEANLKPYDHVPARIDLNMRNGILAYGADRSSKMDWSEFDRINDFELNEILWHAVMGVDAELPPAVRRAIALRPMHGTSPRVP